MPIDKRKNYYLMLDTETANTMEDPMCYDIGGAIIDKKGNTYETFSFVIYEVFCLDRPLFDTAYYAEKRPLYEEAIKNNSKRIVSIYTARKTIRELCDRWQVKAIIAHNATFDYRSTSKTIRYLTKSKVRYFLPYGIPLWDTMKMADETICKQKSYIRWCENNGYCQKNGKPRRTAEILYRYITGNPTFEEQHMGVEDCEIEAAIFAHCLRQHKKMRKLAFS